MYELWVCKEEPDVRLVVEAGGTLPADLGSRDWKLLGPFDAGPDVAAEVSRRGYHFFRSDEPVPHPETLKDSNASG